MELDVERLVRSPFAVGAAGGLVALRFAPGLTWFERAFNVLCGSLCAGFSGPALAEWLQVSSPGMQAGLSFGVGMFGLSLAAAVVQGIRDVRLSEIISGWLTRGGKG